MGGGRNEPTVTISAVVTAIRGVSTVSGLGAQRVVRGVLVSLPTPVVITGLSVSGHEVVRGWFLMGLRLAD